MICRKNKLISKIKFIKFYTGIFLLMKNAGARAVSVNDWKKNKGI